MRFLNLIFYRLCPQIKADSNIGMSCDDGEMCTTQDKCNHYGVCAGDYTCGCKTDKECDTDNNVCTVDKCVDGTCTRSNAAEGTVCDDFDTCSVDDVCDAAGVCQGRETCPADCQPPTGQCCGTVCQCAGAYAGPTCEDLVLGCAVGSLQCECTSGGACDDGLECQAGMCRLVPQASMSIRLS